MTASDHNEEQHASGKQRNTQPHPHVPGNLQCLFSVHVDDVKGKARNETAEPLFKHRNEKARPCKADCSSFLHAGIQHEYSSEVVLTNQYVYIGSITFVDSNLFVIVTRHCVVRNFTRGTGPFLALPHGQC